MNKNTVKIAVRNITRQKKRSILLGSAIAFGVMIIILINGFTGGLNETMKENFTSLMGGHVYINGQEVLESGKVVNIIGDTDLLNKALDPVRDKIAEIHVRDETGRSEIIFGSKSAALILYGVNWDDEKLLKNTLIIKDGSFDALSDPKSIVIPDSVASKLGVKPGETVLVRLDTVTGQRNVGDFTVGAITKDPTGFSFVSAGYADISYLGELLGLKKGEFQYMNLYLKDIEQMDQVAASLTDTLKKIALVKDKESEDSKNEAHQRGMGFMMRGSTKSQEHWKGTKFSITTLNDVMEPVLQMIRILNIISVVLFVILLIITMVGLLNTFRMVLIERTREIGTMRAIGMQKKDIRNIFIMEALFLSLAGAAAGLVLALISMAVVGSITFHPQSSLGFFLLNQHLQFITSVKDILRIIAILSGMTLLAVYLPARRAARLGIADALRAKY